MMSITDMFNDPASAVLAALSKPYNQLRPMKAETPYIHLHERKRTWTPVRSIRRLSCLTGGEEVIQRALALRCLEIPVGDFIGEAMKGDLPDVKGMQGVACLVT